jgi:TRAP-type uncharacterized transport system fused permease subunit
MTDDCARQAAAVAIPIAAIGIIIGIAVQSNLAIKFSTEMLALGGGTLTGSLIFISLGIIVLGMGLPTVAAYVIGAILFVPALQKLGVEALAAHFYVLFFAVLAMVTPPVALASYTAAGIARANPNRTGLYAFILSLPTFLIPIAFVRNPAILFVGDLFDVAFAALVLSCGAAGWIVMISGYVRTPLNVVERTVFGALAVMLILAPFGTAGALISLAAFGIVLIWTLRASLFGARNPVTAGK